MEKILVINPGSTSTKIGVYEDEKQLFSESISHSSEDLVPYKNVADQYEFREKAIVGVLKDKGIEIDQFTCIVARGGLLQPIQAGAYEINEDMIWKLKNEPETEHASNLAAIIAFEIGKQIGVPSYIYDGVTVDQMIPVARLTGFPELIRKGLGHNLNMRAAAIKFANEIGKEYKDTVTIVAHLGGGISVSLHNKGNIDDIYNDEDGCFSPERAGELPSMQIVEMAFSGEYTEKTLIKKIRTKGGLMGYFGVNDSRIVEEMIKNGDEKAKIVYEAMALNVAKLIAALATHVNGKVDGIILTGGIAFSEMFTSDVKSKVDFIAPVVIYGGENEMDSLAFGALRVMRKEEVANEYKL